MGRDLDDERDDDQEQKPKPKQSPYYDQDSKRLTEKGIYTLKLFLQESVVRDDECLLSIEEIEDSFDLFDLAATNYWDIAADFLDKRVFLERHLPSGEFLEHRLEQTDGGQYRARLIDRLGLDTFDPDLQTSTEVEYLVDGLFPTPGVHMLVAAPEALKTWFAYHVVICVSKGDPVLGRFATKRRRVAIVDFEIGSRERDRRLKLLGADERVYRVSFPPFTVNQEKFWRELYKLRPGFVLIDSLRRSQDGELAEQDARFAVPLGRAMKFAEQTGAVVLWIHHTPKHATRNDVESLFSGTGAIRGSVDSALHFAKLRASGRVRRAEVTSVKTRNGVADFENFAIQLTDERGLEWYEPGSEAETEAADPVLEPTLEDRVLAVVVAEPGCSTGRIVDGTELAKDTVLKLLTTLEAAGRIRRVVGGPGRPTANYPVP